MEISAAILVGLPFSAFLIESRPPLPKSLFTYMIARFLDLVTMYFATFGIAVSWVKLVRNTNGLPCWVMAAASPPVQLGTSARRLSAMLTMMEPENTGPKMANTSLSTAFCVRPLATPGLDWVSLLTDSIFLPRMPPAALISLTASSTPFLKLVPAVAPPPDSSTILAILMLLWAAAAPQRARAALAASSLRVNRFFMTCLQNVAN